MSAGTDRSFVIRAEPGLISLEGRITFAVTGELLDAFPVAGKGATVSLDFSGMDSLDVSGINALIKLYLEARKQGKGLRAKGLSPLFREVFRAACLTEAFPMDAVAESGVIGGIPDGWPWARPVERLRVNHVPEGALNLNVDSLKVAGPLQGFGHLWQKTYRIPLKGVSVTPAEVIRAFKERFPSYQPVQNRFYPTPAGIRPGEIVIINASTPAGPISTGVWVLYAGDEA
ncbi:anti-sigma factor antagonist, partial [bacterium]|nr:anti-sigma factor antagonist [bacterium]